MPAVAAGATHVYHQYTIRVPGDRDAFAAALADAGVGTGVYYPVPVHRLPAYGLDLGPAGRRKSAARRSSRCRSTRR